MRIGDNANSGTYLHVLLDCCLVADSHVSPYLYRVYLELPLSTITHAGRTTMNHHHCGSHGRLAHHR